MMRYIIIEKRVPAQDTTAAPTTPTTPTAPAAPAKKPIEFSKATVSASIVAYYIVLVVGVYAVLKILESYPEYAIQALIAMFTYAAAPHASALGFYLWKAKAENLHKHPAATCEPEDIEEAEAGEG